MSMNVKIRNFELKDLKELLEIEKLSFPKFPYSEATFLEWYRIAKDGFFVAELEKKIVGYAIGYSWDKEGLLVSMVVHPSLRRRGIGTKLWHRLLQFFNGNGLEKVRLEVRRSNIIAQNFYEKLGFKKVCIFKCYYEDGEDAISMERDL